MKSFYWLVFCLGVLSVTFTAQARYLDASAKQCGDESDLVHPIDLRQAIESSLRLNERPQMARLDIKDSEARLHLSKLSFAPIITANAGVTWDRNPTIFPGEGDAGSYSVGLNALWNLFRFGADLERIAAAEANLDGAKEILRGTDFAFALEVAGAYNSVLREKINLLTVGIYQEDLRAVLQSCTGSANASEVASIEAKIAEAEGQRAVLQNALNRAYSRYRYVTTQRVEGLPMVLPCHLEDQFPGESVESRARSAFEVARRYNPAIKAADAAKVAARRNKTATIRSAIGSVDANARFTPVFEQFTEDFFGAFEKRNSFGAGAAFSTSGLTELALYFIGGGPATTQVRIAENAKIRADLNRSHTGRFVFFNLENIFADLEGSTDLLKSRRCEILRLQQSIYGSDIPPADQEICGMRATPVQAGLINRICTADAEDSEDVDFFLSQNQSLFSAVLKNTNENFTYKMNTYSLRAQTGDLFQLLGVTAPGVNKLLHHMR